MPRTLSALAAAMLVLVAATGCTDPAEARRAAQQATLTSQLQEADSARLLAGQAVAAQERQVQALTEGLSEVRAESAELQRRVQAFMMEHKMAVAAIAAGAAGGSVALDDSGRFTQEARDIGALVGLAAVGWAMFNMEEVLHVGNQLVKAESAGRALARREAELGQELDAERGALQAAQASYQRIHQQAAGLRTALATL